MIAAASDQAAAMGFLAEAGVQGIALDSRRVSAGEVFAAYPGERLDGRKYIAQAIEAGAGAVLWERAGFEWRPEWKIPHFPVENLRDKIGEIAAKVYGDPSRRMWTIGITGTNGKTSCSHWLGQCFSGLGRKTAVVGTLGNGFPGALAASVNTTPDAVSLHRLLRDYLDQGAQCAAMEVSSHGLAQGRVNGIHFDVAMLTNLSRDHLDYHGDMATYAAAKAGLFAWPDLKYAVLNLDDPFGVELAAKLGCSGVQVVGYSLDGNQAGGHFAVHARELVADAAGIRFQAVTPWGKASIESALLGRFNAANLLAVLSVLLVSGVKLDDAVRELKKVEAVAGRLQRLGGNGRPLVIVDYAHTPDAMEKVLGTLREILGDGGRLICVFGCGGDRDRGKRPLMGEVASRLADGVFVTSDNPRGEEPGAIIEDIVAGMGANYHVDEDRAAAIDAAVSTARPGDIVLIAGKGHEDYQEIKGVRLPFSDVEVVRRVLERMAA